MASTTIVELSTAYVEAHGRPGELVFPAASTFPSTPHGGGTPNGVGTPRYPGTPLGASDQVPLGHPEFFLPPTDTGKDAWLFLFAAFFVEALVWGLPFSFGVFQDYYQAHEPFAGSTGIAAIGTCAIGISFLGFPFVVLGQRLYPHAARYGPVGGLLLMATSLVIASFATSVGHLIATQGVMYAIAAPICYCPCLMYLDEWFVTRRGLAFGIMWSGTGTGGFVTPLVLEWLLGKYGFQSTMRIWAVVLLAITMPLVYFVKPRLPISAATHIKPHKVNLLFLDKSFNLYQLASFFESMGFFLPAIYLPIYARTVLGAGHFLSALTVMLINASAVVGMITMGSLSDRFHVQTCLMICTTGAVLSTVLLWGLASNLATLYAFCVFYGVFASSYPVIWPAMTRDVIASAQAADVVSTRESRAAAYDPIMMIGVMTAGRGIANIAAGPLSEVLIKGAPWKGEAIGAWGAGFGPLVLFTGVMALLGGTTLLWQRLGWMSH